MTTPEERGNQYIDECLAVGRALAEITRKDRVHRRAGVSWEMVLQHLVDSPRRGMLGDWNAEHALLIRTALDDLTVPVVGILARESGDMLGPADTVEGRAMLDDPQRLVQRVGSQELELAAVQVLRVIRDLSFTDDPPPYVPRIVVPESAMARSVSSESDDEASDDLDLDEELEWLNRYGYIEADMHFGDSEARITLAGLIWLRDSAQVQRRIEQEKQRVTNINFGSQNVNMGSGTAHQIIINLDRQEGNLDALVDAYRQLGVPEDDVREFDVEARSQIAEDGAISRNFLDGWTGRVFTKMSETAATSGGAVIGAVTVDLLKQAAQAVFSLA